MIEHVRALDLQFGKELVRGARAWDELEKRKGSGIEVIDFKLAPNGPEWTFPENPFRSRPDALRYFKTLADDVNRDTPDGEYLGAKADASVTFLEYLINPRAVSYIEGMRRIAGYYPRKIPGTELNQTRQVIAQLFYDRYELPFSREGWTSFHRQHGLSPDQAVKEIQLSEKEMVAQVVAVTGVRSHPKTTISIVSMPEYWIGWVTATRMGAEFRVNSHEVNRHRFYTGVPKRMILHEVGGHAVMAQSFADNIRDGLINGGRGDTTVFSPECWIQEAWACEISRVHPQVLDHLPKDERRDIELSVELGYLTDIGYTNAQFELLHLERKRQTVEEDLKDLLPHESIDRIKLVLDQMTSTSRFDRMFYLPVYGDSSYYLRQHVEPLTGDAKQRFTEEIYKQPMTPHQVKELVTRLAA